METFFNPQWILLIITIVTHTVVISWFLASLSGNVKRLSHDVKNLKMILETVTLINERVTNLRKEFEALKFEIKSDFKDVWTEINRIKDN